MSKQERKRERSRGGKKGTRRNRVNNASLRVYYEWMDGWIEGGQFSRITYGNAIKWPPALLFFFFFAWSVELKGARRTGWLVFACSLTRLLLMYICSIFFSKKEKDEDGWVNEWLAEECKALFFFSDSNVAK